MQTFAPNFSKAAQTSIRNQVFIREATAVCALERFHVARGDYPQQLDELVPGFMEKLPHDPSDGRPFRYQRLDGNHFLLYAPGWNGKDDGGNKLDWVWPRPR